MSSPYYTTDPIWRYSRICREQALAVAERERVPDTPKMPKKRRRISSKRVFERYPERSRAVLDAIAAGHTSRLALQAQLAPLSPSIVNHLLNRLQSWGRIQRTGHCEFAVMKGKKQKPEGGSQKPNFETTT